MSSFTNLAVTGAVGVAAGVLGTVVVGKAVKWWWSRQHGSAVEADLEGRVQAGQQRKMKLYHSFPFRSCRCAWLVTELGVENQVSFEHMKLHKSDAKDLMAYREVHPHGTLPSLMLEDGSVLLESSSICLYLAECFLDPNGENLLPDSEYAAQYYK